MCAGVPYIHVKLSWSFCLGKRSPANLVTRPAGRWWEGSFSAPHGMGGDRGTHSQCSARCLAGRPEGGGEVDAGGKTGSKDGRETSFLCISLCSLLFLLFTFWLVELTSSRNCDLKKQGELSLEPAPQPTKNTWKVLLHRSCPESRMYPHGLRPRSSSPCSGKSTK